MPSPMEETGSLKNHSSQDGRLNELHIDWKRSDPVRRATHFAWLQKEATTRAIDRLVILWRLRERCLYSTKRKELLIGCQ